MANIGDVVVQLKADVGQFQSGMRQATQVTQQTTKQIQASGGAAKITGEEWRRAMEKWPHLAQRAQQSTQQLTASVQQLAATTRAVSQNRFQSGWANQADILKAMQRDAAGAGRQLGTMNRFAMSLTRNMAMFGVVASGLPGPLGRIASSMAMIGVLAKPLLLIVGIFAGIAIGVARARKQIEEFTKALETARARRQREMDVISGMGRGADFRNVDAVNLASLRDAARRTQAAIAEMQGTVPRQLGGAATADETAAIQRLKLLNEAATSLSNNLRADVAQSLKEARIRLRMVGESAAAVTEAVQASRLQWAGYPADVAAGIAANERMARSINAIVREMTALKAAAIDTKIDPTIRTLSGSDLGALQERRRLEIPIKGGMEFKGSVEKAIQPGVDLVGKAMKEAGVMGMTALVMGFIEGGNSMKDFLKNFIRTFLELAITAVVRSVLKIGSPSKVAMGWGRNVAEGLAGGIRAGGGMVRSAANQLAQASVPSLSFNVNVGKPGNPLAQARDMEWQKMLRESALVATRGGFRFA